MNNILHFFAPILVFFHVISPVSTPLPAPSLTPSPAPIVSQQPVQKPIATPVVVAPRVDSPQISKCKLEASLVVDKLSDTFIQYSESKLVSEPLYRDRQLFEKAKLQKLLPFEIQLFSSNYYKSVGERQDPAELDALLKIVNNQLINSQKELRDNFSQLTAQQYNLAYLQCINR